MVTKMLYNIFTKYNLFVFLNILYILMKFAKYLVNLVCYNSEEQTVKLHDFQYKYFKRVLMVFSVIIIVP